MINLLRHKCYRDHISYFQGKQNQSLLLELILSVTKRFRHEQKCFVVNTQSAWCSADLRWQLTLNQSNQIKIHNLFWN